MVFSNKNPFGKVASLLLSFVYAQKRFAYSNTKGMQFLVVCKLFFGLQILPIWRATCAVLRKQFHPYLN